MKRAATAVTAVFITMALTVSAWAAPAFMDDFSTSLNTDIRNFDASLLRVQRRGLPAMDEVQLTLPAESHIDRGTVRYRLTGLENISLRIYSPRGTFAALCGTTGTLYFGNTEISYHPNNVFDTLYNPANRHIYLNHTHMGWHRLTGGYGVVDFIPTPPPPAGSSLVRMGVNAYVSTSVNGSRLPVELTRAEIRIVPLQSDDLTLGHIVAEDFQSVGRIPANAQYLWIVINDPGRNFLTNTGNRTSLSWVVLSGRSLRMGRPIPDEFLPPINENPPLPDYDDPIVDTNTDNRPSAAAPRPSAPRAGTGTTSSSSTPRAAPLYEGVITAPLEPQPSAPRVQTRPPEPQAAETPSPIQEISARQEPVIYEISRQPERPNSLAGVIFYIAAVTLLVGYFLLRHKKKS